MRDEDPIVTELFTQKDMSFDAGTLESIASNVGALFALYERYADDLKVVTEQMAVHRNTLIDAGYSCDFSDRESEILYLLVREAKPETVVEISPCHGYSTNYILAALTHNQKGALHSYEIVE